MQMTKQMILLDAERRCICHSRENGNPDWIPDQVGDDMYPNDASVEELDLKRKLIASNFKNTKLWYVSYPKKLLNTVSLPEHMARDSEYKNKRAYPNSKVWVGFQGIINKTKAVYAYNSQRQSYINVLPIRALPLWFYI